MPDGFDPEGMKNRYRGKQNGKDFFTPISRWI
jgi:hypothetical protein